MKTTQRVAKFAESFARNPWRVLAGALILSILAGWAITQLPVHTSRQALLPQDTAVAKRFNHFLENFGAASDLMLVLEGVPRSELETFANDLAARLRIEPEIGQATARLDLAFFLNHAYLLMPNEGLDELAEIANSPFPNDGLEQHLRKALSWSKDHPQLGGTTIDLQTAEASLNLTVFFLEEWQRWLSSETEPVNLDWSRLMAKNGSASMVDGYFASHDGKMLFLFVHPKNSSGDFQALGPFIEKVKKVSAELSEQAKVAGQTPPSIGLTGLPAIEYEEYVNVRQDISLVTFTSAGLVTVLILLVVRSVRWAVLIFAPIGLGVMLSLGLTLIMVGHLTIITAAFIAILFGLGADYGIFTSSRIAEERQAGKPLIEAIGAGIGSSFIAVLTAGGAALLIFSALITVDFPGFSELGLIAATGVLMTIICTWVVQPALYALLPPKLKAHPSTTVDATHLPVGKSKGGRFPMPVAVTIVVLAIGGAVFGGLKGLSIPFDYDLLGMLPKDSQAAYYQRRLVAESDYQAEVIIFTAKTMDEARRIANEARNLKSIAQVQSLTQLFPTDAAERLRKAVNIGDSFAKSDYPKQFDELSREGVSPQSFALLREILENSTTIIDDAEEQAFSAGHSSLVEKLENVRKQLLAISTSLASDSEQGRLRSEAYLRALLAGANAGLKVVDTWRQAQALTPEQLPATLRDRFFGTDGSMAIYAFPAKTVYDAKNLDALIKDIYGVSAEATGFPTTHQVFSKVVVNGFTQGTQLALALCLFWLMAVTRSMRGFALAALPLLIGGGWMLGIMYLSGVSYNFANIVALPLVIALAVDYGVWFSFRWNEMKGYSPWQVSMAVGKTIGLAAGTSLAGLGAITLASYRGVSSLGTSITLGLLCCLAVTLFVDPAIGQIFDFKRKPKCEKPT